MPLPILQKVLGHSSIRTTALYWKNSEDSQEKVISDQWLTGKIPKEPPKPIENNPRNFQPELLTAKNKLLQAKAKQLEQVKKEQEQIIINLKNDKENLTKQLIQVQKEKDTLLKILSSDLQTQHDNSLKQDSEKLNNQELHQQLIAQIQVLTKN